MSGSSVCASCSWLARVVPLFARRILNQQALAPLCTHQYVDLYGYDVQVPTTEATTATQTAMGWQTEMVRAQIKAAYWWYALPSSEHRLRSSQSWKQ